MKNEFLGSNFYSNFEKMFRNVIFYQCQYRSISIVLLSVKPTRPYKLGPYCIYSGLGYLEVLFTYYRLIQDECTTNTVYVLIIW